ncbi:hypothetical protein T4B_11100 [Trichinella pseudospiralis]|nr:hypothetical protein T4B_11100 [Trichinella pseudospiralis]KRZ43829.1 hypothetical protein T4C_10609 [Trichinella pseudospiralis]
MWNADSPAWKYTSEPQMFCLSREQIWWNTTLSSILEEFRRDLRRMNLTGHALYTSVAKPVRCLPMRITHHQLIQVVTLLNSTANFTITEPWCSSWASPIVLQADAEFPLLKQWVTSATWPVDCSQGYSRDLHVMWQQRSSLSLAEDSTFSFVTSEELAKQVLVPRDMRNEIMDFLHHSRYAGYLRERRILSTLNSRIYWFGQISSMHAWCRTCK